jgi:hypothetical protein
MTTATMEMGDDDNDVDGNGAMGNEVDDDGNSATGDDKDADNDGDDHDDGDVDSAMGSSATGYDNDERQWRRRDGRRRRRW